MAAYGIRGARMPLVYLRVASASSKSQPGPGGSMDADGPGRSPLSASRARLDGLVPVVYDELRALAGKLLAEGRGGVTLAPTSLVHEAYLRLLGQRRNGLAGPPPLLRHRGAGDAPRAGRPLPRPRRPEARRRPRSPSSWSTRRPRRRDEVDVLAVDRLLTELEALRPPAGADRRAALLRRPDGRGDRRGARDLQGHRQARLGGRQGLDGPREMAPPAERHGS